MLSALLGKKIGMTQVYDEAGAVHPVTVVQAGPCSVLQVKTAQTDGYDAVQIGFQDVKAHRATQPQIGHAAKANTAPKRFVRECRLAAPTDLAVGATLTVEVFEGVVQVDVIGTTKGKGFAGVMKRHHFAGQPASHGTERKHRSPGSISAHATNRGWGGDIKKGKRMAGHMGHVRCTSRNHKLIGIDKENHLLLIQGSVPGANGGFVLIRASKTAKNKAAQG
ncbi:MAG: 50S ribosomal protein L3 [Phycisphaerae bacterium]|jgi:large subunit ribosomal protein L3